MESCFLSCVLGFFWGFWLGLCVNLVWFLFVCFGGFCFGFGLFFFLMF